MSETQIEYETEQETGAEPTPGPWKLQKDPESLEIEVIRDSEGYHAPWHIAKVYGEAPSVIDGTGPLEDCATEDNARLIAAAGTAAQEAREMGYKPVATMKALPQILSQIESLLQGEYEHEGVIFPGTMDLLRELGGSPLEKDALASAEGSSDE